MANLPWLILGFPLLSAGVIALGLRSKPATAAWLATLTLGVCFGFSMVLAQNPHSFESSFTWIHLPLIQIEFGILVNSLSLLMLLIVTGIGFLIFLYSIAYMKEEKGIPRYFASLSFFAFSMLGVVLSNNLIQTFIFWELVGLSSYLLIGFWFEKETAATAGKKAFLTTRVGDIGMMLGILMLFVHTGTFNFGELALELGHVQILPHTMTAICLLIFMGVMGKSAQMPLHVWLPDAMEGPTPVSALIHAATMVAAGVFLLARLDFLFAISPQAMTVIAWTGGTTLMLMGILAFFQNDIKKILAYSTLSQLGFMILGMGLGETNGSMLHLTVHAFFKALLFLAAGSFIHACHTQDIDEIAAYGGGLNLIKKMPLTSFGFIAGSIAMIGIGLPFINIPLTTSVLSKDRILERLIPHSPWALLLTTFFLLPTYFYTLRLLIKIFSGGKSTQKPVHESGLRISIPLLVLSFFCFDPIFKFFFSAYFTFPHDIHIPATHGLILILTLLAYLVFKGKYSKTPSFFAMKYFFDAFYDSLIHRVQENIAAASDFFERKIIVEGAANGTAKFVTGTATLLRKLQTGMVQSYVLIFVIGLVTLTFLMISVLK
ncbi:MAG: NADH-quinone oxidoreductase subunit L [Candidatus Omnitrophica bacterium]|nr:NADH-quinone oxidoreductase subunit L [Candidatus Omnitrophota bacterium]